MEVSKFPKVDSLKRKVGVDMPIKYLVFPLIEFYPRNYNSQCGQQPRVGMWQSVDMSQKCHPVLPALVFHLCLYAMLLPTEG